MGVATLKNTDGKHMLGVESIPRLVLRFAATTLVALLLNSVYTLTDTLFVSWGVGDTAMGGVSIVLPFVILQGAISTAVGGGAASIISRKLGRGKRGEAGEVALNAMLTFYITAVIITALGFALMDPLLKMMGVTDELYPYAKEYFIVILAGNVFSTGFSSIIRAEGKMLYGLLIWVIPITINIILDAVFILVLGMGVRGSAIATVICQFSSFCMSVLFFVRFSTLDFKGAKLKLKRIGEIFGIGLPSLVQMGSISLITLILNNILRTVGGTLGLTTFAYVSKIITFAVVPFTAIAQALAPIVGFNYGAGNPDRVKKTVTFCIIISFAYAALALILSESIPTHLMRIFTNDTEIITLGAKIIRISSVSLIFTPLPMLVGATFQAAGKKLWSLLMYAANLVFLVPLVFGMSKAMGMDGIWWAYTAASGCAAILSAIVLVLKKRDFQFLSESSISTEKPPLAEEPTASEMTAASNLIAVADVPATSVPNTENEAKIED